MYRNYIYLLIISCFIGCKIAYIPKDTEEPLFRNFHMEDWRNEYKNYKKGKITENPIFKNLEFYPDFSSKTGIYIHIYPQKKRFYTVVNEYYDLKDNTNLKTFGKTFGNDVLLKQPLKIGIWKEYDEQGNLIKTTDEDAKFGAFSYNELLERLHNIKAINLHKGVQLVDGGRSNLIISFFYSKISSKKIWFVSVQNGDSKETGPVTDRGTIMTINTKEFYFDGNTGEQISNKEGTLEYYKDIGVIIKRKHSKE